MPQSQENTPNLVDLNAELDNVVTHNGFLLPRRFYDKTFKTFKGFTEQVELAKSIIAEGKSVFVFGSTGIGKTHFGVALAYEWYVRNIKISKNRITDKLEKQYPKHPIFLPAVELFLELKSGFDSGTSEDDILYPYSVCDLLMIDDVGSEKVSDWSRQVFYTLIDRRYRDIKQTIITSNLSLDALAKAIDERISSRIVEMGCVIKLDGSDYRLKK